MAELQLLIVMSVLC